MNGLKIEFVEPSVPAEHGQEANHTSAQFKRLAEYLDDCRRQHMNVTYLEAADAIEIQAPHRIHRLTVLLEELMEYDQEHGHPLRAALVVSRAQSRLPAEGFFLKAQSLGLMSGIIAEEFHQQCLKRLFDSPAIITTDTE